LRPSPECFLYFYDTRLKDLATWLSLVSYPGISVLNVYSKSFKCFKDAFFRVVLKSAGQAYFYDDGGKTKFPFY